jgi:hypothetical protein
MATDRFHVCPKCGDKSRAGSLFDSLLAVALGKLPTCTKCATSMALHLSFAWGLDAGTFQSIVLDAFLPDEPVRWSDKSGREVTFYPFLVITEGKGERVAWLPYWHVVRGKGGEQRKYGQWAPSMDLSTFEEVVTKARSKGYLGSIAAGA